MDPAELERALDALEARGARLFDTPSCDCVRALVVRAEELGGEAGRILQERAEHHLSRLRARYEHAQRDARERLVVLEQTHGSLPELRDLLEIGDLTRLRRALRRLKRRPPELCAAGERRATRRSAVEYEDSLAELVASFALARAVDVVPEHSGPYNALRIASDLLARMRAVSPLYLTAQLNRLEELASLLSLPELPPPPSGALPRGSKKKRRSLKS